MPLVAYTGSEVPPQDKALALKPCLTAWTSRIWRESPGRAIPLFKLDSRLDPRDIENRALAEALQPYAAPLQRIAIYLLHPEESHRLAAWASGASTWTPRAPICSFTISSLPPTVC